VVTLDLRFDRPLPRRWQKRRTDRGAALFIVVLVILSLTGVALFAARSATTDVTIAGRYKQAGQTRQIARFGMQVTLAELGRDPSTYVRGMKDQTLFGGSAPTCQFEMKTTLVGASAMDTGGCFKFAYDGVQAAIRQSAGAATFEIMQPGDWANKDPSSIGLADTRPNFVTEMTDKVELPWPVPGFQGGQGSNMRFYSVTLTGVGQIVPRDPGAASNAWGSMALTPVDRAAKAYMASTEQTRAQVIVGPLPQGI
jgi:hypothetical protein